MLLQILKSIFNLFCGPSQSPHSPGKPEGSQQSYAALRADANAHGDQMAKCFEQSHEAYAQGNGALAKDLSNQGKEHKRKMELLNQEASEWIFNENNKGRESDEYDLHGLYVKEAIAIAEREIVNARRKGQSQIKFIVGKGLHSQGGVAKVKPAIQDLIQKHNLVAFIDPQNQGVLVVQLDGQSHRGAIGADEISRKLANDDNCIIM